MQKNNPHVSVVILCWNRKDDIQEVLHKLSENNYPNFEVIVVDNGSVDGSPDIIEKHFPDVTLIRKQKNIGIAAYNDGFRTAKGKYIVILDDDSYPEKDAITRSVDILEKEPNTVAIAYQILNPETRKSVNPDWPRDVTTFWGCGATVRRDIFAKAGFYNEDFFLYANEFESAIKMLALNPAYRIVYEPSIIGYHKTAATHRSSGRTVYFSVRNRLWTLWQHFPLWWALRLTVRKLFTEFIFAVFLHRNILAYFKGLFAAIRGLPKILAKRRPIPSDIARRAAINNYDNGLDYPVVQFIFVISGQIFRALLRKIRKDDHTPVP